VGLPSAAPGEDWIPCRVTWQQQSPLVDWCYLGGVRFTEAFFQDTITRALRRPFSATFLRRMPIERWQEDLPDPAGLIFHLSRCGSTLISQMLKAISGVTVFSEAPPVDAMVRAPEQGIDVTEEQHAEWLRWVGRALGRGGARGRGAYILKLDCWHAIDLEVFRRAFPVSPWIFLYRSPVEVLASHAAQPGEWTLPGYLKSERFGFDAAAIPPAALAEHRARLLAGMMRSVLEYGNELEGHLVNYSQLPSWGWTTLPQFFGLNSSAQDIEEMQRVAAKDARRSGVPFNPDPEKKRSNISQQVRALSEEHLDPLYRKLEELRKTRCANNGGRA
jgi:hypothetical protein